MLAPLPDMHGHTLCLDQSQYKRGLFGNWQKPVEAGVVRKAAFAVVIQFRWSEGQLSQWELTEGAFDFKKRVKVA